MIHATIALMLALVILAVLAGCTQEQVREQSATEKLDRISASGTVTVPTADGPHPVPVSFVIDRRGSEDQRRESDARTSVDGAAIGPTHLTPRQGRNTSHSRTLLFYSYNIQ